MNDKNDMIPKVIHYIWLGGKRLDKVSIDCIGSWKKKLPNFKITRWDESNTSTIVSKNKYASEAYEAGKFAFVSDYLRLYILYHFGGIYMDTDVKVLKNFDSFLMEAAFTSFENERNIPTALMAAQKGNRWIKTLLDYYSDRNFIKRDGKYDMRTNVEIITEISESWGLVKDGTEQVLNSCVHIYPKTFFCPIDQNNRMNDVFTENTYAVHLFNSSWLPIWRRAAFKVKRYFGLKYEKLLGKKLYSFLKKL